MLTEIGRGAFLIVGLLTPFGGAVSWVINHRGKGFFIFRPGEGWKYVATLGLCGVLLDATSAGSWSLKELIGINDDLVGFPGLLTAVVAGIGGAAALLATCWRPPVDD
ncbi:MAG: hypothetical protein O3C27_04285 [Actinomycetota bacterium]|nr:hypothetical protein [Actinomycetota bacterium]